MASCIAADVDDEVKDEDEDEDKDNENDEDDGIEGGGGSCLAMPSNRIMARTSAPTDDTEAASPLSGPPVAVSVVVADTEALPEVPISTSPESREAPASPTVAAADASAAADTDAAPAEASTACVCFCAGGNLISSATLSAALRSSSKR